MRNHAINRIFKYAEKNRKIFLISGDAGFGVLDKFKKRFPDRFLNMGVAEQNAASFSAGMALAGYKVVMYNIIPFLLYRCYEQVRNDICYQRLPVILIGVGSGVTYAPQGITHYSVEDIAIGVTLPNLTILSPSDPFEVEACVDHAMRCNGPAYIRVAKSGEPAIHKKPLKSITKPIIIKEGKGVAVLFHGSIGVEVMKAVDDLSPSPMVISVPMVQPIDFKYMSKKIKHIHTMVTIEEHFSDIGLGGIVAGWICKDSIPVKLIRLGITREFIHKIKNNAGMREAYGISADKIKAVIKGLAKR